MSSHDQESIQTGSVASDASSNRDMDAETCIDTAIARAIVRAFFDRRDYRAVSECLLVTERTADADGTHSVYSEDGTERTVDIETNEGNCEDMTYNNPPEPGCKHVRRAQMEVGERPVPPDLDRAEMDPLLVEQLDDGPAFQPALQFSCTVGQSPRW